MTDWKGKVIIVGGVVILVAATWLAFRRPGLPILPGTNGSGTGQASSSVLADAGIATGTVSATGSGSPSAYGTGSAAKAAGGATGSTSPTPPRIQISFTAPTSSSMLVIGKSYDITWNRSAGRTGQLYLVAATSDVIVGWVEQSIGPAQVMYPWKARSVFTGETSPVSKDVLPGKYILKLWFGSPQVPIVVSAPFMIVPATASTPSSG